MWQNEAMGFAKSLDLRIEQMMIPAKSVNKKYRVSLSILRKEKIVSVQPDRWQANFPISPMTSKYYL